MRYVKLILVLLIIAGIVGVIAFGSFSSFSEPAPPSTRIEQTPVELLDRPLITAPVNDTHLTGGEYYDKNYEVIGHSVQGRELQAHRFGTGPHTLIFVGTIHGGYEWNTALLSYELIDHLRGNPQAVPSGITVIVVPVANPDGLFKALHTTKRFGYSEGPRFAHLEDISPKSLTIEARYNARNVDLNRNFDCKWQASATWAFPTNAGTSTFSEPEALALRDFLLTEKPEAVVFFHSASNGVYSSYCDSDPLPGTVALRDLYSTASGYPPYDTYAHYTITGDAADWLSTRGIPAVTVELSAHDQVEWERNWPAIQKMFEYYSNVR